MPVVGLLPITITWEGKEATATARMMDEQIARALRARGFKVIDADVYRGVKREEAARIGALYDSYTGKLNERQNDRVVTATLAALREQRGAVGFVQPFVDRRVVDFEHSDQVQWEGVEENVVVEEEPLEFLYRAFGMRGAGKVRVLSLKLSFLDDAMEPLYESAGGIGAGSAMVNGQFAEVDEPALLADRWRIARAVDAALQPPGPGKGPTVPIVQFQGEKPDWRIKGTLPLASAADASAMSLAQDARMRIRVIALTPLDTQGHPQGERVRERYERELTQALVTAGYRVVDSAAYAGAVAAARRDVGGRYDPFTGEELTEKRTEFRAALQRRFGDVDVDGILSPSFVVRRATYDSTGTARWDGIARSIAPAGELKKTHSGIQPGLSLSVTLADIDDRKLYAHRGGIELASKHVDGEFKMKPYAELLLDEGQCAEAVRVALVGLTRPATE